MYFLPPFQSFYNICQHSIYDFRYQNISVWSIWSFWRHLRVSSLIVKFLKTLQDALILAKLYIMMYFCTLEQNGVKDVIIHIFSKFLPRTVHLSRNLRNMNWDRLKYFGDILESQTWFESLAHSTRHLLGCNRRFSAIPP